MFEVIWAPSTMDDLARIWMNADRSDRERITEAVSAIDQELKRHAAQAGESRDEDRRIFFEPPLGINFHVSEEHQTVVIARVWRFSE